MDYFLDTHDEEAWGTAGNDRQGLNGFTARYDPVGAAESAVERYESGRLSAGSRALIFESAVRQARGETRHGNSLPGCSTSEAASSLVAPLLSSVAVRLPR